MGPRQVPGAKHELDADKIHNQSSVNFVNFILLEMSRYVFWYWFGQVMFIYAVWHVVQIPIHKRGPIRSQHFAVLAQQKWHLKQKTLEFDLDSIEPSPRQPPQKKRDHVLKCVFCSKAICMNHWSFRVLFMALLGRLQAAAPPFSPRPDISKCWSGDLTTSIGRRGNRSNRESINVRNGCGKLPCWDYDMKGGCLFLGWKDVCWKESIDIFST